MFPKLRCCPLLLWTILFSLFQPCKTFWPKCLKTTTTAGKIERLKKSFLQVKITEIWEHVKQLKGGGGWRGCDAWTPPPAKKCKFVLNIKKCLECSETKYAKIFFFLIFTYVFFQTFFTVFSFRTKVFFFFQNHQFQTFLI